MMRVLVLLCVLGLASSCDMPAPLNPSNPYDPEAPDRIVTGPSDLQVLGTAPTSVTLSWKDRSSFEAGFDIQEVVNGYPNPSVKSYESVAALQADEVTHQLGGLIGTADLRFRVVATDTEGETSTPTNEIALRYPQQQTQLSSEGQGLSQASFSIGGETVYAWNGQGGPLRAFDSMGGRFLYEVTGRVDSVHPLADGRSVLISPTASNRLAPVRAQVLSRSGIGAAVILESSPSNCYAFSVSADGRRVAGSCPFDELPVVAIWELATGELVKTFAVGPSPGRAATLLLLSPTAESIVVGGGNLHEQGFWVFDVDTENLVWRMDRPSQNLPSVAYAGDYLVVSEVGSASSFFGKIKTSVFLAQTGVLLSERESEVGYGLVAVGDGRIAYRDVTTDLTSEVIRIVTVPELNEVRRVTADFAMSLRAAVVNDGIVVVELGGGIERWDFAQTWELVPN